MTIAEMKETRLRLSVEANSLVKADMNAETRAKIERIYADADALKADIALAERAESLEAELRSSQPLPASKLNVVENETVVGENPLASVEYKKAHNKFLRFGKAEMSSQELRTLRSGAAEVRTQSSATGASGGYVVPIDLSQQIEEALKFYGGMRQVATIMKTGSGAQLNWPTYNDVNNVGAILSGNAPEQDITFGVQPFGAWTYTTKSIAIQNELLEDSDFPLEDILRKAFVDRIGRIQNTHFTVGTGSGQPNGLLTASTQGILAATGNATSITYDNLVNLIHSVDIAYRSNAKFMFNDLTLSAIRQLTDNYGRPLLGQGINGGDPDSILGYKYQINQDMPVMAASANSLLFGDFSKYMIRDVANSLTIMRLDQIQAVANQTVFVGFVRADGQLLDAGTHPSKFYTNSAS